jgi:hypothetical protein
MTLIMVFAQLKLFKVPDVGVTMSGTGEERGVYI